MRKVLTIALLLCTVFVVYAAETAFDFFTAKSDGKVIAIEWRASVEKGIRSYEIERASSDQVYRTVTTMDPKGSQYTYRFVDEDALMKGDQQRIAARVYSYRLKMVAYDNSVTYSNSVSVAHSVSGIRRTWGMIKEMFR